MDLGIGELVVIFLVVMILFGANKLPALGEGLGKAIRGFKSSLRDEPASTPASDRAATAEPASLPPAPGPATGGEPAERKQPVG